MPRPASKKSTRAARSSPPAKAPKRKTSQPKETRANGGQRLTQMQEDFCLTYLECRNATEAYRQSYNVKPDTKPGSVWTNASKLMANPKVALRIAELEDQIAKITLYSVKQAHEDLETVKGLALKGKTKSLSAANRAISTQMKLHGLGVERHEFSGPDGGPIPLASISDDDLDREIARLAGITGKK